MMYVTRQKLIRDIHVSKYLTAASKIQGLDLNGMVKNSKQIWVEISASE